MASLTNYLRPNRRRLSLSQEEVAFLLGVCGTDRGIKVSRDENLNRRPNLETALAYEAIYGIPIRELFAGLYAQVERDVAERTKILRHRKNRKSNAKQEETISRLVSKLSA